jgi:hypothetical protein
MDGTIIFLSIVIIILSLMLVFKLKINLDVFSNNCRAIIYLFGIRIIRIDVNLILLTFQINNNKNKKSLNLFLSKEQEFLLKQMKKTIIDKLYYDDIFLEYELSIGNPSFSAISIGVINSILHLIKIKMLSANNDTNIVIASRSNLKDFDIKIDMQIKVFFTLFDLFFALIISFYKRGMYAKQKR